MSKLVEPENELSAKLYLKPGDRDFKPIVAFNVRTNDIVLRISVPKRTGRKRKRGSDDAFTEPVQDELDTDEQARSSSLAIKQPVRKASRLLRSLRDNEKKYDVSIAGRIEETYRFRSMFSPFPKLRFHS